MSISMRSYIQCRTEISSRTIFICCILLSLLFSISAAKTCKKYTFPSNKVFHSCRDLPVLQAHLHWSYIPSTRSVHIAYRAAQTPKGWVSWAINPTGTGMIGSQAIVAFSRIDGSMNVYPTPINSYNPSMQPGSLTIPVSNISATYGNNQMTIFAVLGPLLNGTTFNLVWQEGSTVSNGIPQMHSTSGPNIESSETLDFLS
ncbi:hypothetical protein LWI28_013586 [Acer negundo]|uniref:DOMON domain-containing protein n=1 Tax=Acer negundo TaxID=4023 RepID=A0AAD5NS23_ACENE|nr:hypothetical protein LWI28_013586 [Acer negundo]